jgi:hypothetical protein
MDHFYGCLTERANKNFQQLGVNRHGGNGSTGTQASIPKRSGDRLRIRSECPLIASLPASSVQNQQDNANLGEFNREIEGSSHRRIVVIGKMHSLDALLCEHRLKPEKDSDRGSQQHPCNC